MSGAMGGAMSEDRMPQQHDTTETPRQHRRDGLIGTFLASSADWKTERPGMTESVGVSALSYLLSGPVLFALIGYGLDRLLHVGFLVPVGLLAGMALSIYLIWFRYGAQ